MAGLLSQSQSSQVEECLLKFYRLTAGNYPIHQKFVFSGDNLQESHAAELLFSSAKLLAVNKKERVIVNGPNQSAALSDLNSKLTRL